MRIAAGTFALVAAISASATGQGTIASRVAPVRDGVVRMEYPSRPGVCGDGKETIGFRDAMFARNFQGWGTWHNMKCTPGNVRVTLTIADGEATRVRTQIGGSWLAAEGRVTDLGIVSSTEAAAYFISLVPKLETESGKDRTLLPAVLADDAVVLAPLMRIARDANRTMDVRRQALTWIGLLGDRSVVPTLVALARERSQYESEKKSLTSPAVHALSQLEDGSGVAPLLELSRDDVASLRKAMIFGLAETDDPRALRRIKEMLDDSREPRDLRKDALFWLGQRPSFPTADIVAFYRATAEPSLKEHAIFVLSQRPDDGGADALLTIAKEDTDRKMRGKAMFWLAQKNDPRVTKLLSDILVK